ncbi:MAG TPA: WYL domain-containing protein [Acidimicrobiales bacterium]|nr:WYL domain-containing protein [Acidimicrobiales bacterium]
MDVVSFSWCRPAVPAGTWLPPLLLDEDETVAVACRRGERVRLDYCDRADNATSRFVDPHRLVRAGQRWYLVARDTERAVWRTFRVDRAEGVVLTGIRVEIDDPPDALCMVSEAMGLAPYPVKARVRLPPSVEEAAKVVPRTVGVLSANGDGATIVELGGPHLAGMVGFLAALPVPCEILAPDELRAALRAHGELLAQANR